MNEEKRKNHSNLKRLFDRLVICFQLNLRGFWKLWWEEVYGLALLIVAVSYQIVGVVIYPIRRLIIRPVREARKLTDVGERNAEKILYR